MGLRMRGYSLVLITYMGERLNRFLITYVFEGLCHISWPPLEPQTGSNTRSISNCWSGKGCWNGAGVGLWRTGYQHLPQQIVPTTYLLIAV